MDISESKVNVTCPKCKFKISVSFNQIKRQEAVFCPNCNSKINLVDKEGSTEKAVNSVNESFKKLHATISQWKK